jgi:hypothetical protein
LEKKKILRRLPSVEVGKVSCALESILRYFYTLDYDDGSQLLIIEFGSASDTKGSSLHAMQKENTDMMAEMQSASSESKSDVSSEEGSASEVTETNHKLSKMWAKAAKMLLVNVRVYSLADKYDVTELKELAKSKFEAQAHHLLSTDRCFQIIRRSIVHHQAMTEDYVASYPQLV